MKLYIDEKTFPTLFQKIKKHLLDHSHPNAVPKLEIQSRNGSLLKIETAEDYQSFLNETALLSLRALIAMYPQLSNWQLTPPTNENPDPVQNAWLFEHPSQNWTHQDQSLLYVIFATVPFLPKQVGLKSVFLTEKKSNREIQRCIQYQNTNNSLTAKTIEISNYPSDTDLGVIIKAKLEDFKDPLGHQYEKIAPRLSVDLIECELQPVLSQETGIQAYVTNLDLNYLLLPKIKLVFQNAYGYTIRVHQLTSELLAISGGAVFKAVLSHQSPNFAIPEFLALQQVPFIAYFIAKDTNWQIADLNSQFDLEIIKNGFKTCQAVESLTDAC